MDDFFEYWEILPEYTKFEIIGQVSSIIAK